MIPLSILQYRREQATDIVDIDMILLDALGELENAYKRIRELEASVTDGRNGRPAARPRAGRPHLALIQTAAPRDDNGYELTWEQRRFLNTHKAADAEATVVARFADGAVRVRFTTRDGRDEFVWVDQDGSFGRSKEVVEVAFDLLADSAPEKAS